MSEETIDVEVNLGKEMADKINSMTKKELINNVVVLSLRNHVQDDTVERLEKELARTKEHLDKAEDYVEQARGMIEAITERWYHYE